jgi:tetrahydromethanopterin S-methyltransferase subunit B
MDDITQDDYPNSSNPRISGDFSPVVAGVFLGLMLAAVVAVLFLGSPHG